MSGTSLLPPERPFKGLAPFTEEDGPFFFGRDADRELILANLLGSRLTLFYGASGAGKSSVLQAGVAYKLRQLAKENLEEQGKPEIALAIFNNWRDAPKAGLLLAVRTAVEEAWNSRTWQDIPPQLGLTDALRTWTDRLEGDLLIVLDQFEEFFLYHPRDEGPGCFSDELASAVNEAGIRVSFLIAIREDALAWLDRFKGKIPGLFENYLRLEHLDRKGAREAIQGPVEKYGEVQGKDQVFQVEPLLVEAVLEQVAVGKVAVGEVGKGLTPPQLSGEERIEPPYLQLVMTRLWDEEMRLGSHILRLETLKNLEGAERIIQTHLDNTLTSFTLEEQKILSDIFRYLVTPHGTKIALAVPDLADFTGIEVKQLGPILERLAGRDVRILRLQGDGLRYEIFHDVLASAILDWRRRFMVSAEQTQTLETLKRERLRFRRIVGLGTVAALLGLIVLLAQNSAQNRQRSDEANRAEQHSRTLNSRRIAQQAITHVDRDPTLALLLSIQASRMAETIDARRSLLAALRKSPGHTTTLHGHAGTAVSVAFSSDGRLLASGGFDGSLHLWSAQSKQSIGRVERAHDGPIIYLAFNSDNKTLASSGRDGKVRLWNTRTRKPVAASNISGDSRLAPGIAFNPNDSAILAVGSKGRVIFWDYLQRKSRGELRTADDSNLWQVAYGSEGKLLLAASDKDQTHFWDLKTREHSILPTESPAFALHPDGDTLATSSQKAVSLWSLRRRRAFGPSLSIPGPVAIAFTPRGDRLAANDWSGIGLWDVKDLAQQKLLVRAQLSLGLAFSPDGESLATSGLEGLSLVSLKERAPYPLSGNLLASSIAFSPDGALLALGSTNGTRLWSVKDRQFVDQHFRSVFKGNVKDVAFSPDGKLVAMLTQKALYLLLVEEATVVEEVGAFPEPPKRARFSPDGKGIAILGPGGLRLWSLEERKWEDPLPKVAAMSYIPGDKLLALSDPDGLFLWEPRKRKEMVPRLENFDRAGLEDNPTAASRTSLAVTSDGKILAAAGEKGVRLWSLQNKFIFGISVNENDRILGEIPTPNVFDIAFSPDGTLLATIGTEGVCLWNAGGDQILKIVLDSRRFPSGRLAFSPDGRVLVSVTPSGVRVFNVDLASWRSRGCQLANRNLSKTEWREFVGDVPFEKTCPGLP